ncbi:unnamed protein product [Miscanthus lutarioriparius]|uniref:beta-galactosidase n=1 Tax=Miscanthus lutarioriparius TaxID=422564 RepID=A0A811NTX3_9POAL|nr:unnamed protein product [Miscanthus lutarioriparius]
MSKGILPCFWCAPTDNDKGGFFTKPYASRWREAFLDNVTFHSSQFSVKESLDNTVEFSTVYYGVPGHLPKPDDEASESILFRVKMVCRIHESGDVVLDYEVNPRSDLPPLPRVGVVFSAERSLSHVTRYGRGPFECYPDHKASACTRAEWRSYMCRTLPPWSAAGGPTSGGWRSATPAGSDCLSFPADGAVPEAREERGPSSLAKAKQQ